MNIRKAVREASGVCLIALFAVLTFGVQTSLTFHEIAGIAVGVLIFAHGALGLRRLKTMAAKRLWPRGYSCLMVSLDLLLTAASLATVVSGLLISRRIFTSSPFSGNAAAVMLHNFSAYIALALMAAHTALHGQILLRSVRYTFRRLSSSTAGRICTAMLAVGIAGAISCAFFLPRRDQPPVTLSALGAPQTYGVSSDSPVSLNRSETTAETGEESTALTRESPSSPSSSETTAPETTAEG